MVERQRGRGPTALIRESSGPARGPIMYPEVPAITNGHAEDTDIEDPYLVEIAEDAELDGSKGKGDFDFVPAEKDQALDATSLHLRDIGRIPMQIEMHEQWGEEISAGKIALAALKILNGSEDCLSEKDRARVSELLGKRGKFLLKRFHMKIQSTRLRVEKNEYEGEERERLRQLDIEFLETVSANEELAKDMLTAWKINEGEDPEGSEFHQFLNQQIRLAHQGVRSFANLVEANLRLSVSIARKHFGVKGMSFDDLTGYGHEGLLLAAADWDVRMGFQFSTYATWWIQQRINRRIDSEGSMIRVSVGIAKKLRKRKQEQNGAGDSEDPSLPDILKSGLRVQGVVSLDRPLSEGGDVTLQDYLIDRHSDPSDTVLAEASGEAVQKILAKVLKERDIRVLQLRLGLSEGAEKVSLEKVGQELGVTRERIRQLQARALKKLRRSPEVAKALKALVEP